MTPTVVAVAGCAACGDRRVRREREARDYVTGKVFALVRCEACGVVFTWPRPASLARHYPPRYREYAAPVAAGLRALYRRRVRKWTRDVAGGGRALEVGCGAGWMLAALSERGWRAIGVERTVEQAAFASRVLGVPVIVGGPEALREGPHFDLIFLFQALEHLDRPVVVLRECAERLKPGGRLIVAVPNYGSWQARWAGHGWFHLDVPRHLFHFTPQALAWELRRAGLEPATVSFASWEHDPYGWVQSLENRLGLPQNALTRWIMGLEVPLLAAAASVLLAALLAVPAAVLAVASWLARAGAIVEMTAVKPRFPERVA